MDFDLTSMCTPRLWARSRTKSGCLLAGAAKDNLAAVSDYVRFELLEIIIEIFDGVLLDRVGFGAKFLIIG